MQGFPALSLRPLSASLAICKAFSTMGLTILIIFVLPHLVACTMSL